jgi:deazaflavin-dependent nitroreductase family protein
MAKKYQVTWILRLANIIITTLLRCGLPMGNTYLLTVHGRKTGTPHTTPVTLIVQDGQRWLIAPYGAVGWVRNLRATKEGILSRGRYRATFTVRELAAPEAAPILQRYLQEISIVRPYFEVAYDAPLQAIEAIAPQHPVFQINPIADQR